VLEKENVRANFSAKGKKTAGSRTVIGGKQKNKVSPRHTRIKNKAKSEIRKNVPQNEAKKVGNWERGNKETRSKKENNRWIGRKGLKKMSWTDGRQECGCRHFNRSGKKNEIGETTEERTKGKTGEKKTTPTVRGNQKEEQRPWGATFFGSKMDPRQKEN